jgi:MFS family permease
LHAPFTLDTITVASRWIDDLSRKGDRPAPERHVSRSDSPEMNPSSPGGTGAAVSWRALLSTYLPALILSTGVGIALPAIPALANSFHVSFGVASGVITLFLIGSLCGTIPAGWLVDRFGRRPVLIAGPLIIAAAALGIAQTSSFTVLLALRFVSGFAQQMWLVSRLAAISHGAAANQRGRQISWMYGMDNIGRLVGPLLGGFLAANLGIRSPFIAYALLALVALIPTTLFSEDTPRRVSAAGEANRITIIQSLRDIIVPRLPYFGVALFAGLTRGPFFADLFHLYAAYTYHLGPAQIGYLAAAAAVIALPLTFLAGWLLDNLGRTRTMIPGFLGVALSLSALAVSAYLHLNVYWYVALFLLAVITQSLTGGSVQTIGADVAPPKARGTFLGLWQFTGQGGQTLGPILFALLADTVSPTASFVFTASCALGVLTLLIVAIPRTRAAATMETAAAHGSAPR